MNDQPSTSSAQTSTGSPRPPIDPRGTTLPPPPPPGYYPMYGPPAPAPKQRGIVSRIAGGLIGTVLITSIVLNVYLFFMVAAFTAGPSEVAFAAGDAKQRIVILPIEGTIDSEMADYIHEAVDGLAKDLPAAIVLRVESGGGSVVASDQIWHSLEQFKSQHPGVPIIASFGGVAASGGYYVATPASHIICEQTGITGSIGVMAQVPTMGGLMEKLGVQWETFSATGSPRKTVGNDLFRPWNEQDRAAIAPFLDEAYVRFTDVVKQGRPNITPEQLTAATTGEAFTAAKARDLGLIDGIGYLQDAIDQAVQIANLPKKPKVTIIRRPQHFGLSSLMGSRQIDPASLKAEHVTSLLTDLATPRLHYVMQWR